MDGEAVWLSASEGIGQVLLRTVERDGGATSIRHRRLASLKHVPQ